MQKQDKTITIYKSFVKHKLLKNKKNTNVHIEKCKKIYNELSTHADTYSKALLNELKTNITALMLMIECDLIDYTISYIENKTTENN